MLSVAQQAALNLDEARSLRAAGRTYREIGRQLALSSGQLSHIRRALKREKASQTRLRNADPRATPHDLPISQSALPPGLRRTLVSAGFRTLGDLAARIDDRALPALETLPGIGPHRARLVRGLLDQFGLLSGADDLRAAIEHVFPELQDG